MCSLSASPEPSPSQCRPGYIAASVAEACATIAGCQRKVGAVTPGPMSPVVRSPRAVSTFQTNAACPCAGTHGWKWSAAITPENPCASACAESSTTSVGWNCSSIAAYPTVRPDAVTDDMHAPVVLAEDFHPNHAAGVGHAG